MSRDPFKDFKDINALATLAADQMRGLRDLEPAMEQAARQVNALDPRLETARGNEENLRRIGETLQVNAAITPFIKTMQAEMDAARPFVESMQRTLSAHADDFARLQAAVDLPGMRDLAAYIAERPAGLAALLREATKFEGIIKISALAEAQQMATAIAASMPRLADLTPERFGFVFPAGAADAAWLRFAAKVEAAARADDTGTDTIIALAEDADALTAAAPAESKDQVALFGKVVLGALVVDLCKDGIRAGARALLPYLAALPVLFQPLSYPTPPAAPPSSYSLPAMLPPAGGGDALAVSGGGQIEGLPEIIKRAGPKAARRTFEFFAAQIRNRNTRQAYANAVVRFFNWCDDRNLELQDITPFAVAAYVEQMQRDFAAPTVKQHLAAIRMLFDYLVVGQVLPMNPASSVRGPKYVVKKGKTPVLQPDEARLLLDSIDVADLSGLRDRALLGVMIYSFARVSAVVGMNVDDYYQQGKRWWLRLHEKGDKHHEVPAHHKAEEYLDAYIAAAGLAADKDTPLWRSMTKTRRYGGNRMSRVDVFRMVKRRVRDAELGEAANCHTFRATGITAYLLNGGTLEKAQMIAAHESPRTTKLYDRTSDEITLDEIERIVI